MGLRHKLFLGAVCASFATYGSLAAADKQTAPGAGALVGPGVRLPVAYVDRGITNPAAILTPELDFGISKIDPFWNNAAPVVGTAALGAGYSVTDDFGLRGTVFVLQFNNPFQLASAGMGGTYRFARGAFEAAIALDWIYQAPSNHNGDAGMVIEPSVPLHVHFGRAARLDITPTLPISTAGVYVAPVVAEGGGQTTIGLYAPVKIAFQLFDPLHLDLMTGFDMTFNPDSTGLRPGDPFPNGPGAPLHFGDTFYVPLGVQIGISVPGPRGPILDMTPFFEWPGLLTPGVRSGVNGVDAGMWFTGVNFTTYFYL